MSNTADNKVLVGLSNGANEPENVLIAYLMGVEALRAGKQATTWLTKDGVDVATVGFAATIEIEGALRSALCTTSTSPAVVASWSAPCASRSATSARQVGSPTPR